MYLWKTKKLAEEIRDGKLSEEEKRKYYIWTSILYLIGLYIITASAGRDPLATLIEAVAVIAITIAGVNITFRTNKGAEGSDYVGRMLALSFPLLIKILVISFAYGFVLGITVVLTKCPSVEVWSMPVYAALIQLLYFWRMNCHLKTINS